LESPTRLACPTADHEEAKVYVRKDPKRACGDIHPWRQRLSDGRTDRVQYCTLVDVKSSFTNSFWQITGISFHFNGFTEINAIAMPDLEDDDSWGALLETRET
jgi:hypothetical protein